MWPLVLKLVRNPLVVLAAALAVVSLAWYTDHALAARHRTRLDAELEAATARATTAETISADYAKRTAHLAETVVRSNTRIGELEEAGAALAAQLAEATRRHAAERRAWQARMTGVLAPLPSDCEGAVREQARRSRAMLQGVAR